MCTSSLYLNTLCCIEKRGKEIKMYHGFSNTGGINVLNGTFYLLAMSVFVWVDSMHVYMTINPCFAYRFKSRSFQPAILYRSPVILSAWRCRVCQTNLHLLR